MTDYFPDLLIPCCLFPWISSRTPPLFSSALFVVGLLERRSLSPDFQLSEVSAHRIILETFLNHSNIFPQTNEYHDYIQHKFINGYSHMRRTISSGWLKCQIKSHATDTQDIQNY